MRRSSSRLLLLGCLSTVALLLTYSNHFHNQFQFDDAHSIVSNGHIRDIRNIPSFFRDASTYTSLPSNQAHRPVVTTLNALDYWIAGGLDPFYFHVSIFLSFIVLGVLLFLMFKRILDVSSPHPWNIYFALAGASLFQFHAVNAETINYISARSDSFSTLCIVASLVLYQHERTRRYHLHLLTMIVGIYTKQTAAMFAPLLFVYVVLFGASCSGNGVQSLLDRQRLRLALRESAPALLLTVVLSLVNVLLTPDAAISSNTTISRLDYLMTQLWVIAHYVWNFFVPVGLSADPHFTTLTRISDWRVVAGLTLILAMLGLAIAASRSRAGRPVAYGIIWFFLGLAPTSSIVPLFQVANYHRVFLPYIGLVLSIVAALSWGVRRSEGTFRESALARYCLLGSVLVIVAGHAYGTRVRSEVWSTSESLWSDAARKNPDSGRTLLNYGLTLMEKGDYQEALRYYEEALALLPYYSYIHINLGILKDAMGDRDAAKRHFEDALRLGRSNPEAYYYYARASRKWGDDERSLRLLRRSLEVSPAHTKSRALLDSLSTDRMQSAQRRLESLLGAVESTPTAENYLDLSLVYYTLGRYEDCIAAATTALGLRPAYAPAYNNVCSAYSQLGEWDQAIAACQRALEIDPSFARARANLAWARQGRAAADEGE